MTSTQAQLETMNAGAFVAVVARDALTVTGLDAQSFLQSLISQDIGSMKTGDSAEALLLQPQGKLIAWFRITALNDQAWLLDCDHGVGTALRDGLVRFKIRVKCDIVALESIVMVRVRGANADTIVADLMSTMPIAVESAVANGIGIRAQWGNVDGVDWIGPQVCVEQVVAQVVLLGATEIEPSVYESLRVANGVLVQGIDIDDTTIAQEAALETTAVSFTKGCFVGQELVCRIDSRGHVNRFVRKLQLPSPAALEVGAAVEHNGKAVGAITSVAPHLGFALATIRREVAPGATVQSAEISAIVLER